MKPQTKQNKTKRNETKQGTFCDILHYDIHTENEAPSEVKTIEIRVNFKMSIIGLKLNIDHISTHLFSFPSSDFVFLTTTQSKSQSFATCVSALLTRIMVTFVLFSFV